MEPTQPTCYLVPPDPEELANWARLEHDPDTLPRLCALVAAGGVIWDALRAWRVPGAVVYAWLSADPDRMAAYDLARMAQADVLRRSIRDEVARLGRAYVVGELSADEAERLRKAGQDVLILKPADKLRALELNGREVGMYSQRVAIEHTHKVAGALKQARARAKARIIDAPPQIRLEGGGEGISAGTPPTPPTLAQKNSVSISPGSGPLDEPLGGEVVAPEPVVVVAALGSERDPFGLMAEEAVAPAIAKVVEQLGEEVF